MSLLFTRLSAWPVHHAGGFVSNQGDGLRRVSQHIPEDQITRVRFAPISLGHADKLGKPCENIPRVEAGSAKDTRTENQARGAEGETQTELRWLCQRHHNTGRLLTDQH
ncbi:hypothetical protein BaRGS_00028056 [Batillaria attramentaria]|uniref:Uncharacterized protein n=1 Tax=Batillaria attramentaria TaxID=370345 RepID=A0ABD0K1F8_9CAEN